MSGTRGGPEARTVRVLLMASGINSLTQRILVDLKDTGYDVTVTAVADQAADAGRLRPVPSRMWWSRRT